MFFLLILALLVLPATIVIYFIPTFVAKHRNHHNLAAIFLLNLLLGWSFIGWALALIWSMTRVIPVHQPIVYTQRNWA